VAGIAGTVLSGLPTLGILLVLVLVAGLGLAFWQKWWIFSPCPPDCANRIRRYRNWNERELVGINLSGANLYGTRLRNANLFGANLSGTILIGADLGGANLEGADLTDARLAGARLVGADLEGASLSNAQLAGARLIDADLEGASLSNAQLAGAELIGANLEGADLTGARLAGAKLIGANLRGASLGMADLSGALLLEADLTSAYLAGAKLVGANLLGASLRDASISGTDLRSAALVTSTPLLDKANYSDPTVRAMSDAEWAALSLDNTDLTGASYRTTSSRLYCKAVCAGAEPNYTIYSSGQLTTTADVQAYTGPLQYDTLCATLAEVTCNCPWVENYRKTLWPEGFTPPPEAIPSD
jgi:uncharacterized protein YjbI with pentapeptide repeats